MRFALLGDHRDGLDFADALTATGRHELRLYCGARTGLEHLQRRGHSPRSIGDAEALLADPEIDVVVVAGGEAARPAQLRRALQAEHHVLCVHPADPSPDVAYEAALIQADTGRVLLPLLPMTLHPSFRRLAELARTSMVRLVELEIFSSEEVLFDLAQPGHKPSLPGWDVLRLVGGEIAEIYAQSVQAELLPGMPLLLSGRFVGGILLQATYVPNQAEAHLRLSLLTTTGRSSVRFPHGWPGPADLTHADETGTIRTETWDAFDPWLAILERFELAVLEASLKRSAPGHPNDASLTGTPPVLGWQDELRALELDDAARRSAERGRCNTLDLQETTEEATFKGTMTLVGCSLIWLTLIVLILSMWLPMLAWLIVPFFAVFLAMQALRWAVPSNDSENTDRSMESTRKLNGKVEISAPPAASAQETGVKPGNP
jgi:hypothetical protein